DISERREVTGQTVNGVAVDCIGALSLRIIQPQKQPGTFINVVLESKADPLEPADGEVFICRLEWFFTCHKAPRFHGLIPGSLDLLRFETRFVALMKHDLANHLLSLDLGPTSATHWVLGPLRHFPQM